MTEEVLACFPTETVLGDKGYLGKALQERLKSKGVELITPLRKNMKQSKINFPHFAKRKKIIERVFSFHADHFPFSDAIGIISLRSRLFKWDNRQALRAKHR